MLTAHLTLALFAAQSGLGISSALIADRDKDGRPELVLGEPCHSKKVGALRVVLSGSAKIGETIQFEDNTFGFGWDVASVDHVPTENESRLLVTDPWQKNGDSKGEGVVHLLKRDFSIDHSIRAAADELRFGKHLYVPSAALGSAGVLASNVVVQFEVLDDKKDEYSGRECFAIYDLRTLERRCTIRGSSEKAGVRNDSVLCAWLPDQNGDGVIDLAIDMRDSVVIYSGADLKVIRTLSYAKMLDPEHDQARSLAYVKCGAGRNSALAIGLPSKNNFDPGPSCLLLVNLDGPLKPERVANPGCGCRFGVGLCQIGTGELFVTANSAFAGCLAMSKPFEPRSLAPWVHEGWLSTGAKNSYIGAAIRNLGDFDGDGVDDVALTTMDTESRGVPGQGVIVYSGKTHTELLRVVLDQKCEAVVSRP